MLPDGIILGDFLQSMYITTYIYLLFFILVSDVSINLFPFVQNYKSRTFQYDSV